MIFGLGTLVGELWLWFGNFGLGSLVWDLWCLQFQLNRASLGIPLGGIDGGIGEALWIL